VPSAILFDQDRPRDGQAKPRDGSCELLTEDDHMEAIEGHLLI